MTETELDLARRLAGHAKWAWMRGMRVIDSASTSAYTYRLHAGDEEPGRFATYYGDPAPRWASPGFEEGDSEGVRTSHVPDLADPATQGCLWAMLCEASVYGRAEVRHWDHGGTPWRIWVTIPSGDEPPMDLHTDTGGAGDTYGEALARALLAAWGEQ